MPQATAPEPGNPLSAPPRLLHRHWVPLPLLLLVAATFVDVIAALTAWRPGIGAAYFLGLAGLVAAIPAATLGTVDALRSRRYAGARPARVGRHAASAIAALLCYALNVFLRAHPEIPPDPPVLALSVLGALLLLLAAGAGVRVRRALPGPAR